MLSMIVTTSDGEKTPFLVNESVVERCIGQLADANDVLELPEQNGTAYIPVRHVIAMYVPGGAT